MLHNILIGLHAAAGVASFASGIWSLNLQAPTWRFRFYFAALLAMILFLGAAIAVDWPALDATTRVIYSGLFGLGLYMVWRAVRARTRARQHDNDWRSRYVADIGFTLIALFDGFVIVGAIDLGADMACDRHRRRGRYLRARGVEEVRLPRAEVERNSS